MIEIGGEFDYFRTQTVFFNNLENAMKYTKEYIEDFKLQSGSSSSSRPLLNMDGQTRIEIFNETINRNGDWPELQIGIIKESMDLDIGHKSTLSGSRPGYWESRGH